MISKLVRLFGHGKVVIPQKIPKVESSMSPAHQDQNNYLHKLPGFQGESLHNVLQRHKLAFPFCCGTQADYPAFQKPRSNYQMSFNKCFNCGVIVQQPWYSRIQNTMDKRSTEQKLGLQGYQQYNQQLRAACHIEVLPALNGIEVRYAANQQTFYGQQKQAQ